MGLWLFVMVFIFVFLNIINVINFLGFFKLILIELYWKYINDVFNVCDFEYILNWKLYGVKIKIDMFFKIYL